MILTVQCNQLSKCNIPSFYNGRKCPVLSKINTTSNLQNTNLGTEYNIPFFRSKNFLSQKKKDVNKDNEERHLV